MTTKDAEQDRIIQSNAERITRNEEAIRRQTAALEQIRDHYYPARGGWVKRSFAFLLKVFCAVLAYVGACETLDWLWNLHSARVLSERYASVAAQIFFHEGNAVDAARFYEKTIEINDGETSYRTALLLMKGMALSTKFLDADRLLTAEEQAQVDAALADAFLLQKTEPENPMPYVLMAQALMLRDEREEAVEAVRRAVACDPKNASVRVSSCTVHFTAGRIDEARRELAEAERLDATLPLVASWKGLMALSVDRDVASARTFFAEGVRRSPRLPLMHVLLGKAYLAGAKPEVAKARAAFRRAYVLDPRRGVSMCGMAETYEREGKFDLACVWLDRALAVDANDIKAHVDRARVYGATGRFREAVADLTAAVALCPFRADIYRLRADAYEKTGDAAKAGADRALADEMAELSGGRIFGKTQKDNSQKGK